MLFNKMSLLIGKLETNDDLCKGFDYGNFTLPDHYLNHLNITESGNMLGDLQFQTTVNDVALEIL